MNLGQNKRFADVTAGFKKPDDQEYKISLPPLGDLAEDLRQGEKGLAQSQGEHSPVLNRPFRPHHARPHLKKACNENPHLPKTNSPGGPSECARDGRNTLSHKGAKIAMSQNCWGLKTKKGTSVSFAP